LLSGEKGCNERAEGRLESGPNDAAAHLITGRAHSHTTRRKRNRPKGYIGATSPPAEGEFKGDFVGRVEEAVRDRVVRDVMNEGDMGIEEFTVMVKGMGMEWTEEQIEGVFDALDREGKGRVDKREIEEGGVKGWFK